MLTCHDARALIVRTIDDPQLPSDARASLRLHLAGCASCLDEYETQHEVRRLLALHIEEPVPAGFAERLSARLTHEQRRLEAEKAMPETIPTSAPAPAPEPASAPAIVPAPVPAFAAHARGLTVRPRSAAVAARLWTRESERTEQAETASRLRSGSWRMAIRLLPVAATIALIIADAQFRAVVTTPSAAPTSSRSVETSAPVEAPAAGTPTPAAEASSLRPATSSVPTSAATSPSASTSMASRHQAARVTAASRTEEPSAPAQASAVPQHEAAVADANAKAPVMVERIPPVAMLPIVTAPDLADSLKLSDSQRKEIDAAIERLLTPDQRKLYRERQASPPRNAQNPNDPSVAGQRNANERDGIRPRPTTQMPEPPQRQQPPW